MLLAFYLTEDIMDDHIPFLAKKPLLKNLSLEHGIGLIKYGRVEICASLFCGIRGWENGLCSRSGILEIQVPTVSAEVIVIDD